MPGRLYQRLPGLNEKVEALQERLVRDGRAQPEPSNAGVWQGAALLVLALGIGLAGRRGETVLGG